jgi:hypothetical protein
MCYDIVIPMKPGIYSAVSFDGFELIAGSKRWIERFEDFEGI